MKKIVKEENVVKGFKGFDKDLKCRGFQYEIGKVYETNKEIELCSYGFHFCKAFKDVNSFYDFSNNNYRYCEVEALGQVIDENDMTKSVTDKIKIVREVSREEMVQVLNFGVGNTGYLNTGNSNTGGWNTGYWNTGYSNTGYRNTGDWNTGNSNTGDWNTGDWNTGSSNTGFRNTGDSNTGDCNTGNSNTGGWNTGDWNKTNRSSGIFCTKEPKMIMFNKETDMTFKEWRETRAYDLLSDIDKSLWIHPDSMTDEEKQQHPSWETVNGYLKEMPRKEASSKWWGDLDNYDKQEIFNLPNFDLKIFNEIMELDITTKEYKEVLKNANN